MSDDLYNDSPPEYLSENESVIEGLDASQVEYSLLSFAPEHLEEFENSLSNSLTPLLQNFCVDDYIPGCSHWPLEMTHTEPGTPPKTSGIISPPYKPTDLIIMSTNLQSISRNRRYWKNKKLFHRSRVIFVEPIAQRLTANRIICQTLRFKTLKTIRYLRMKQKLVCRKRILERWLFEKGYIRPDVIHVWETIMKRSSHFHMDASLTSRVTLETHFYDGSKFLYKYKTRVVFT